MSRRRSSHRDIPSLRRHLHTSAQPYLRQFVKTTIAEMKTIKQIVKTTLAEMKTIKQIVKTTIAEMKTIKQIMKTAIAEMKTIKQIMNTTIAEMKTINKIMFTYECSYEKCFYNSLTWLASLQALFIEQENTKVGMAGKYTIRLKKNSGPFSQTDDQ